MPDWSWNPPPESGIAVRMVSANGLEFEVAEAGCGDRVAILLHGFPELNFSWRHQIPVLAALGYRAWAVNLRGYGATSRPSNLRDYALDRLVADVVGLIDASQANELLLVGHDWGAVIAWATAIARPESIDRLVIMNVLHPLAFQRELRRWQQLRKSWYMFFFQLPWLPEKILGARGAKAIGAAFTGSAVHPARFPEEDVAIFRRAAQRPGAIRAMLNFYRALFRYPNALDLDDGTVRVPTLMLWGERDIAIDIHCLDGTENWVPDLHLERFPDASHWVQQDVPEMVNTALTRWLA